MARTKVNTICMQCGETFKVFPCKLKNGGGKYCGRKCMGLATKGENNPYYGKKHSPEIKKKMTEGWDKVKSEGYKPHNYIDGNSKDNKYNKHLHTPEWKNIRKAVLIRDKHICRLCETSAATTVHHIVPYRISKTHNVSNLISLCVDCHEITYNRELEYISLFMSILMEDS